MEKRIASGISIILHPFFIPSFVMLALLNLNVFMAFVIPLNIRLWIQGMIFVMTFAMPTVMIFFLYRAKIISSFYMEERSDRFYPLLMTGIFWGMAYYLLSRTGLPVLYYAFLIGGLSAIIVATVVNHFWKISIHMLGMGGLTGVFLGMSFRLGMDVFPLIAASILFSGLVGYSRIKLNSHNPSQVYTGYGVGVFLMVIVYLLPLI
jgi:membrane-associated phospholipid phosphatase